MDRKEYTDLGELKTIATSGAFRRFLAERKQYLQGQVNTFVREQKWTEAYGALMRLEDIDKLMSRLQQKIIELEKGK